MHRPSTGSQTGSEVAAEEDPRVSARKLTKCYGKVFDRYSGQKDLFEGLTSDTMEVHQQTTESVLRLCRLWQQKCSAMREDRIEACAKLEYLFMQAKSLEEIIGKYMQRITRSENNVLKAMSMINQEQATSNLPQALGFPMRLPRCSLVSDALPDGAESPKDGVL